MAIDFSNINLSIMDLSVNTSPDIFINTSGVSFSKRVLEDLGYPANVQYCLDADQKVFAVKVCRSCDIKAVSFIKAKSKPGNTYCTANKNLKDTYTHLFQSTIQSSDTSLQVNSTENTVLCILTSEKLLNVNFNPQKTIIKQNKQA